MTRALIVYGTTEGQTAKIAHHIAHAGRRLGHGVDVANATEIEASAPLDRYSAALVGASLHEGRYQREVARFVDLHKRWLHDRRLSGFFSVSLGAASSHPEEVADVLRMMEAFGVVHGWLPDMTASFAGALKYTQYNWLKRALMRHVAKNEGGSTDTSRDHEYTNWRQVDGFARRFFGEL
jgi:menaquinone-dependent protoporphyrinogen oxidase